VPVDLWTSAAFIDEVAAWVGEAAGGRGLRLTGAWEQPHARPWSSAISFETDDGRLWFKVNGPGTAHEAALTGTLATVVPDLVPDIIAVEAGRGWSLMRDAGPQMRSLAEPGELWDRWELLLPVYAEAQRTLSAHVPTLLDEGLGRTSPSVLPGLARELLDTLRNQPEEEGGLGAEDAGRIEAALPSYDDACAELAASGIPDTLTHDDLHSANVCWGDDGPRIIDWGDASVGHPFGDMLATLNSIVWHAKVEDDDPRVQRVRAAYLEPFGDVGTEQDRLRWVALARRVGVVPKAIAWAHAFEGEPADAQAEFDWPVRGWLLDLLEP